MLCISIKVLKIPRTNAAEKNQKSCFKIRGKPFIIVGNKWIFPKLLWSLLDSGRERVYGINERAKKNNKIEMINIQNTMCEKKKKYTKTHV